MDLDTSIKNFIKEATKAYNSINDYEIEIGVIDESKRKSIINIKDITNGELMYIHENGSPTRNIPKRPVLRMSCQYALFNLIPKTLKRIQDGCFKKNWNKNDVRNELEKMCMRLQSYARSLIRKNDGTLQANAPSTIKKKGDNHPLFDTGQLMRSITCRLVKKGRC